MIRFRLERRPQSTKLTWSEIKEVILIGFFLVFSLYLLFLSALLLTGDGVIIRSLSGSFGVFTVIAVVGLVALGVDRLVSHYRAR
jgi:hypothetical protein